MDPTLKTLETQSRNPDEPQNPDPQSTIAPIPTPTTPPMGSISVSLSTILPTHLHLLHPQNPHHHHHPTSKSPPKSIPSPTSPSPPHPLLTPPPKAPSNPPSPPPLSNPLFAPPREGPPSPPTGQACAAAQLSGLGTISGDFGKSSSGFDKTGPFRATFLVDSVSDLRRSLRGRGSDLVVRIGRPESVLLELAKAVGADAVYAHREVSGDEVQAEEKIEKAMKDEGVEFKSFWGSTLFHVDDLPFKLEEMPLNYGGFRDKVQRLEIRKTIQPLDQLKGLPSGGDVDAGEIPTLLDLGLSPTATITKDFWSYNCSVFVEKENFQIGGFNKSNDGKPAGHSSLVGGETEALQRLTKFAAECQAQPHNGGKDGSQSIYGANFSCKISPWLTMGCLSPRFMFDELKKSTARTISAVTSNKDGNNGSPGGGMNWLLFELLWRDFFRFITKKYSSAKKMLDNAPVTGCTGAAVA
ncbi:hypothetical protein Sjap_006862 [Stephania japonica]|uniref:Photolyase/cryptochrome alpha/beta domain-containing protein n=1 Tax=Stephania japonica TaxID=461633 RepID=A0AAP0K8G3_9MAGN